MFLKEEKDPNSQQFDDDEWIRSLTAAQDIPADVLEDSVMNDQQAVDPKKVWPIQMGEFLRKYVSRLLALSGGEIAALTAAMRLALKAAPRPLPSSTSSSTTSGPQDH